MHGNAAHTLCATRQLIRTTTSPALATAPLALATHQFVDGIEVECRLLLTLPPGQEHDAGYGSRHHTPQAGQCCCCDLLGGAAANRALRALSCMPGRCVHKWQGGQATVGGCCQEVRCHKPGHSCGGCSRCSPSCFPSPQPLEQATNQAQMQAASTYTQSPQQGVNQAVSAPG